MVIDLPFEGRKVEGSWKYSRRERVPKVRSRGEETITEPINSRIGEFHPEEETDSPLPCGAFSLRLAEEELALGPVLPDKLSFPFFVCGDCSLCDL